LSRKGGEKISEMISANHLEPLTIQKGGKRTMKGKGLSCLVAVALLVGIMGFSLPPAEVQAKPIVIKVVQSWPKPVEWNRPGEQYIKWAELRLKGKVKFNILGGPEVIPAFQQGEAVRNGVVDMMLGAITYYSGIMPEVDCFKMFTLPPWELRKKGVFDYYNKLHAKKLNAFYIGNTLPTNVPFHLYTTFPVKSINDFKGKTIRVAPIYRAFVKAMGGSPTTIATPEVYTALQRGTVEGLGWPEIGLMDLGWHEVIKYRVDPGFYALDGTAVMNLDKWKSLPRDVQEGLVTALQEIEKANWIQYDRFLIRERKALTKAGVQILQLEPKEAERYRALAYKAGWDELLNERAPKEAPKIKAMLEK
jgi:TRAP-type C4-dicarboxylate transport system substrate-binding protein